MARQHKAEIQEYAFRAEPCDTSSLGFRPRTVQENAGYTLNMTVTGNLKLHQAVVHHGTANEFVVASALNSKVCDENVRLYAATHAYIVVTPLTVPACALHHCSVSATLQNFPTALSHSLKSECVGQHAFSDEKGQ